MILVTGGTGLVGSYLLYQLALNKKQVRATYRASSNLENVRKLFSNLGAADDSTFNSIEWVLGDVNDIPALQSAVAGVATVYHCAALVSFNPKDSTHMEQVNVAGTQNLVNCCIEAGVHQLCHVSSVAVMAKSATKKLIQEDQVSDYKSLSHAYAKTKHAAEMEVWRGSQEGLEVVVVRPGVILGAGFWKSGTGRLFERINKGLLFYTEGVTGYVSVEDVTNAMILLIETNCFGKAFTLVAENRSFKSIFFQMAHSLKASQPKYLAKKWMTSLFWRIEMVKSCVTGKEPKLTKHTAKAIHGSSCFAAEEVKKAINFQFEPIDACIKRVSELYLLEN